jgi:hypothetical protein
MSRTRIYFKCESNNTRGQIIIGQTHAAATQNGINLTSITIPVATAVTAGPYVVYYIDPLGCSSPTSPLYNQPLDPTPVVSISGVNTICAGNSTLLSASTSVGAASAYQWYNNGTIIAGATSASYNVSTPGNYNVKITSTTGCMDSAAVGTTCKRFNQDQLLLQIQRQVVCVLETVQQLVQVERLLIAGILVQQLQV